MGTTKFTIKVFQEGDGSLYAEVAELPGCFTVGKNIKEIGVNMKEAIECYLEGVQKDLKKGVYSFDYEKQYA